MWNIDYMMELPEELNELIREGNIIKAMNESIAENFCENTAKPLALLWPDLVRRKEKLVTFQQSYVPKAVDASKYTEYDFSDILTPDRNSYLLNVRK
jgi:hypothetical protein